jgi:hypothetical protein
MDPWTKPSFTNYLPTMNFIQITAFDNYVFANMTLGLLEENNINCHLSDENVVTLDPLLSNAVGGIKLMVADVQFERAIEVIKQAEAEYLTGIPCPQCQSLSLKADEKINNPSSFWGKLKNQLAYGQTSTYVKLYRCGNCKNVFTELPSAY